MKKALPCSTLHLNLLLVSTLPSSDSSPFQPVTLLTSVNTQTGYLGPLGKYKVWPRIHKHSKNGKYEQLKVAKLAHLTPVKKSVDSSVKQNKYLKRSARNQVK